MEPPGGRRHSTTSDGISSYKHLFLDRLKDKPNCLINRRTKDDCWNDVACQE